MTLPPLPLPRWSENGRERVYSDAYSADQMRAYGEACTAAARADERYGLRAALAELPPLPPSPAEVSDLILQTREHVQMLGCGNRERLYTESQVRAIMAECAAMAAARQRERCAQIVAGEKFRDGNQDARRGPEGVGTWHESSPMGAAMRALVRAIRGHNVEVSR